MKIYKCEKLEYKYKKARYSIYPLTFVRKVTRKADKECENNTSSLCSQPINNPTISRDGDIYISSTIEQR